MSKTPLDYTHHLAPDSPPGYDALQLALTQSLAEEAKLKALYAEMGKRFVVTEIGGTSGGDFQEKINRSVLGAALNAGLVQKTPHELHALLHATEEAKRGVLVNAASSVSLALKVAIVRQPHWIAVAMYGQSSIHPVTSHERCGLGVMHL